jgi:hypothetical protein
MESMMLGTPVLATAYSGNMSFMNHENSFLAGFRRVTLGYDRGPYEATNVWADPIYEDAGRQICQIFSQPNLVKQKVENAKQGVKRYFSPERVAKLIRDRISLSPQNLGAQQTPLFST